MYRPQSREEFRRQQEQRKRIRADLRALSRVTTLIIFGGIRRIARVSGVIVPIMALGYIVLALGVVLFNLGRLPEVLELIVADAFGVVEAASMVPPRETETENQEKGDL